MRQELFTQRANILLSFPRFRITLVPDPFPPDSADAAASINRNALPLNWPGREHSQFVEAAGVRWHLQRCGQAPDEAITVLLLHGTGGSTHSWAAIAPLLAAHCHLLLIDLPGHGFSELLTTHRVPPASAVGATFTGNPTRPSSSAPFALDAMARAVGELLQILTVRPALVLGHSAGVTVALQMVLDGLIAPQQLVGVCPALIAPPTWYTMLAAPMVAAIVEQEMIAIAAARLAAGTAVIQQMLASTGSTLTAEQMARYQQLCSRPTHVQGALTMMARWDLPTLARRLPALTTPTTLLAGRQDRWIPLGPLTRAVQSIPHLTFRVEEGGHLLPEEHPEIVARALLPFVR
jgi:magnesium chelatase accessory protein